MKREKIIAAVLAASMALSLTGCDSDNENVIKVAEDYAEALISLDIDDIAGLMEDEDEAAEELARIEEICDADPDLEDAFAAVSESMTYEIDDKSVVSSKKDKEASVDIVFTLADYEAIHEEIEAEDGDLEAYIDALEDPDETVEVKVTVKFVLVKDKWLVKDKNFKNLNKVLGFIDVISEYSWGILKMPADDEFIYAVCAAFDVYEDDIYQNAGSYSSEISYDDSTFSITMQRYNDPEEAEFFSFGTNDLTQMGFGFSRDDTGAIIKEYMDRGIFDTDPFQSLDQSGIGKLVKMAVEGGKSTRPNIKLGICGEHGGDPASVRFCHEVGLNYVSCSPFRVPIARLAAAQAAIAEKRA